MKKIIFKTVGWIAMIIIIAGLFTIDPVDNPLKFILQMIAIVAIDDIFDLYILDKFCKIKDWFIK